MGRTPPLHSSFTKTLGTSPDGKWKTVAVVQAIKEHLQSNSDCHPKLMDKIAGKVYNKQIPGDRTLVLSNAWKNTWVEKTRTESTARPGSYKRVYIANCKDYHVYLIESQCKYVSINTCHNCQVVVLNADIITMKDCDNATAESEEALKAKYKNDAALLKQMATAWSAPITSRPEEEFSKSYSFINPKRFSPMVLPGATETAASSMTHHLLLPEVYKAGLESRMNEVRDLQQQVENPAALQKITNHFQAWLQKTGKNAQLTQLMSLIRKEEQRAIADGSGRGQVGKEDSRQAQRKGFVGV